MEVTPQEAKDLLGQTDTMAELIRNHSLYRRIGPTLILWGMIWLGAGVTLLAMTGFGLFANQPQVLNVWMGVTGGLTLLATGIFAVLRAR